MSETTFLLRFDQDKIERAAYTLKAVVHPTRIAILDLLEEYQEMTVTDFVNTLDGSPALLSHHLTDMRSKNILKTRREGQFIYYSIKEKAVLGLLKCIQKLT
jgi:ArsR family transcriptional regulator